jgi:hypothetical protein
MKNQRNQLIALVVLVIGWAAYWHFFIKVPRTVVVVKAPTVKVVKADSLLQIRLHKIRAEMDSLYHYRINPATFDTQWNPFRIPKGMEGSAESGGAPLDLTAKTALADSSQAGPSPDYAEKLLKSAIASMRIGGVVTLNGITQLTVDGQLHKEGDEFTAKVPTSKGQLKFVLIRIRLLSTSSVTLVLESEGGGAEMRVRLN